MTRSCRRPGSGPALAPHCTGCSPRRSSRSARARSVASPGPPGFSGASRRSSTSSPWEVSRREASPRPRSEWARREHGSLHLAKLVRGLHRAARGGRGGALLDAVGDRERDARPRLAGAAPRRASRRDRHAALSARRGGLPRRAGPRCLATRGGRSRCTSRSPGTRGSTPRSSRSSRRSRPGRTFPGVELLPELAEGALSEAVRRLAGAAPGSASHRGVRGGGRSRAPGARRRRSSMPCGVQSTTALRSSAAPWQSSARRTRPSSSGRWRTRGCRAAGVPPSRSGAPWPAGWGFALAGLAARRAPVEDVAWLLRQRLLPGLSGSDGRVDPLPLLRRAGVRDAALGAEGAASAYEVRLTAYAGRRREVGDGREAERAERLLRGGATAPRRGGSHSLAADVCPSCSRPGAPAWRSPGSGPRSSGSRWRRTPGRAGPARARPPPSRSGARSSGTAGPGGRPHGCAGRRWTGPRFARWLLDAAGDLPVSIGPGVPGGVDVLPLESLGQRRFAFLGIAGVDAASLPRRAAPALLGDEERQAIHGVLGRVAVPSLVGSGDARAEIGEALDRWRLGRALASAGRVVVTRRRAAGGAPADVVQRLLAVTGAVERDVSREAMPLLEQAPGPSWARAPPRARGVGRAGPAQRRLRTRWGPRRSPRSPVRRGSRRRAPSPASRPSASGSERGSRSPARTAAASARPRICSPRSRRASVARRRARCRRRA